MDDQSHGEAQIAVHLAHPHAVTPGQVVVYGDDVHALSRQGVEIRGQHGHKGLAFAGLHLRDPPLMKHHAADELHPVRAHAQHPVRRLPDGGKGVRQNVLQRLPVGKALLEPRRLGLQLLIAQGAVGALHLLDFFDIGLYVPDLTLTAGSE